MVELTGFQGITQAVSTLKEASVQGFTVTDEGAKQLTSALQEVLTQVESALAKGYALGQEPALGTTPAASAYKPFLATIWTDAQQGGQPVLTQLKQDLEDAINTINKASVSYQANEAAIKASLA
ncbi:MAG TPA: hypothetical protein VHW44_21705 [Pseudonocardiaceae bacterium]|jgi:hypothetical protein|nr:hypothetical protein [Pseudonocardiaceae bacterium]